MEFFGIRDHTSSTSCITRLLSASFSVRPDKAVFAKLMDVDEKEIRLASCVSVEGNSEIIVSYLATR